MALEPGNRFGSYQIGAAIGAGGMGEVYRATDTTLERDVALKVLPASFAEDAERVTRFEREAKTLASLNHPNIAQIYGLEKSDGTTALVMELVDGVTLEERIAKGPIQADEALGIAMQIADALEAAHGQNIVHRDLKPANIKLKSDGTVKVLDFGIAKALAPESLTSEPQSPIMTTPATQVGVILGTAAYMSPEQAKGKAIDQRTDIWAFGCVLYEMLSGQLAFGAEDVPTTLARIIANDTNLDSLPSAVSPAVRKTIELCLEKDPRKRLHAIGDVRLGLEGAFDAGAPPSESVVLVKPRPWQQPLPVAAAALIIGAVIAALVVRTAMQPTPPPVDRFSLDLGPDRVLRGTGRRTIALGPSGRQAVFNTNAGLLLRDMGELNPRVISGTERVLFAPVFAPDGQQVAYWTDGQLLRIAVSGGSPAPIGRLPSLISDLRWQWDDTLLVSWTAGISRVSANGGTPELIVPMAPSLSNGMQLLPDGETVLFSIGSPGNWNEATIVAHSLTTGERTAIWEGGSNPRYLPTGHLVYIFDRGLHGLAFDVDTLTVTGGSVPLVQGIAQAPGATGIAQYDVSDDGTLAYVAGGSAEGRTLLWVYRDGSEEDIPIEPDLYTYPRISPDGTRVVLDNRGESAPLWIWDFESETRRVLTIGDATGNYPIWTPDGERIAYNAGGGNIDWKAANNTGAPERFATEAARNGSSELSPYFVSPVDGSIVFRSESNPDTFDDIGLVASGEDQEPVWLLGGPFTERNAELSPDGRWMAYQSDESGRFEIHVVPFPDVESDRWQVSYGGGWKPLWSRDGSELFYLEPGEPNTPDRLMSVSVDVSGETLDFGERSLVLEWPYRGTVTPAGRPYDIDPDGTRFLAIRDSESNTAGPNIVVVQNWFEELKRLVPTE